MSNVSIESLRLRIRRMNRPAGMIILAASVDSPDFSAPCDGTEVSRRKYPELFEAIGTKFGKGDGTTTFNLPTLAPPAKGINYYINLGLTDEELAEVSKADEN